MRMRQRGKNRQVGNHRSSTRRHAPKEAKIAKGRVAQRDGCHVAATPRSRVPRATCHRSRRAVRVVRSSDLSRSQPNETHPSELDSER
uniref:Uncharacterized protein n=1 Tax=Oryza punctata TaxID=4537 RepID=A0A0E0KYS4_ORYPU